jgi:hypothetical protein
LRCVALPRHAEVATIMLGRSLEVETNSGLAVELE